MRKRTCAWLLLLALGLAGWAGCRGGAQTNAPPSKPAGIDALVAEINSFTDELVKKVESASDTSAGVDGAQALLDARREELKAKVRAVREGREFRENKEANGRLLECEVSNGDRVSALSTRYLDQSIKDPSLRSKLTRLRGDYNSIFD
jgi:hypothetical protein